MPPPCIYGHQRKVTGAGRVYCPTCNKRVNDNRRGEISTYKKSWKARNHQKVLDSQRKNAPKHREQKALWYQENKERTSDSRKRNRSNKHPLFATWIAMNYRCHKPNSSDYERYGAKGISVHEPWRMLFGKSTFETKDENNKRFQRFLTDLENEIGTKPDGTTLDRYPNLRGGYEPGNIRWATPREQAENRVTNPLNRKDISEDCSVSFDGKEITLSEISHKTGIDLIVVKDRYARFGDYPKIVNMDKAVDRRYPYRNNLYSLYELALISGIPYTTIKERLRVRKWSVERSIGVTADTKEITCP